MTTIWKFIKFVLVLAVISALAWVILSNYSVIFSKTVIGEIIGVEKVELPVALVTRGDEGMTSQIFSFAIGIKDTKTGEIFTASSEDRQWAVAEKGKCAEAVFLPYPPWNLMKKDTFYGARLIRLFECPQP